MEFRDGQQAQDSPLSPRFTAEAAENSEWHNSRSRLGEACRAALRAVARKRNTRYKRLEDADGACIWCFARGPAPADGRRRGRPSASSAPSAVNREDSCSAYSQARCCSKITKPTVCITGSPLVFQKKTLWTSASLWFSLLVLGALLTPRGVSAEQRFALIVSGATGGQEYAAQYTAWTDTLSRVFADRFKFGRDALTILSETETPAFAATAENVRRVIGSVRDRMTRDDLFVIILIGHGTFDGVDAKFNLVGRDLESAEWAALLRPLTGRVVIVNTTAGSFPFIERLAGPRRIVITATDSVAQRFDTVFPEYFVKAFEDESADLDKNQRISIWEAFASASAGVRRHYQQRGQLSTERALIDDNGDGTGRGAADEGQDGTSASRTYLEATDPGAPPTDEELLKLLQRKSLLEAEVEELRIRRSFLPPADYAKEFERVMIELAKVARDIRQRKKT